MREVYPPPAPVPNVKGAIYLGVSTLLFLAVVCVYFTTVVYEHTEHVLSRSWWIRLPLVVLALDLGYISVVRFRRSWSQAGMICTHAGLIVVLTGSFITCLFSSNGMLEVAEGESSSRYAEDEEVLAVKENPQALPLHKTVVFSAYPDVREDVSETLDVPGGTTVTVDKYYRHFRPNPRILNDSKDPNPCLHVVMGTEQDAQEALITEQHGGHGQVTIEGRSILLFYSSVKDEEELRRKVAALPSKRLEVLSAYRKGVNDPQRIEVATSIGKDIAIEGTPYQIRINKVLPTLQVTDNKVMTSADDHPWNPVLLATLTGPKGAEEKKIFPTEMEPPHGAATWPDDLMVRYEYAPYFEFVRLPDGRHFVMGNLMDDMDHAVEVKQGELAALRWVGMAYKVAYYSNARVDRIGTPDNANSAESPAVHVTVRNGAASRSEWVPISMKDDFVTFPVGNGEVQVGYQKLQRPYVLPFQVHLDKFVEDHYEGTSTPSAWHSFVTVTDSEKGASFQYTIQMNEPLRYRGWKLFQSGKDQDESTGKWVSTLSVSWDPGDKLIYPGCVLVVSGVLFMFYFKKPVQRWESRRLEARGAAPKASKAPVARPAHDPIPVRG